MINNIAMEAEMMKNYFTGQIETIYFGGGTPSLLSHYHMDKVLQQLKKTHLISTDPEITLEANPDDITMEKLDLWKSIGINRLSIGIQSFDPVILQKLNRVHSREQATCSLEWARAAGFKNLSVDLIFAIPDQSIELLESDLEMITQFQPTHVATYNLTVEPKTVFGNWKAKGVLKEVEDDTAAEHYTLIMEYLTANGFDHYEISNFALPGFHSRHNSSYWQLVPYLGLGPGAHSFNGTQRHYNISNNALYMKGIENEQPNRIIEDLTNIDRINEYIMTSLRRNTGCDLQKLKQDYNFDLCQIEEKTLRKYIRTAHVELLNNKLILTRKGKYMADQITAELFQLPDIVKE